MTTAIVPVDFSINSVNAAKYAAQLLSGYSSITLVLMHCFHKADEAENSDLLLNELKNNLNENNLIKIEILSINESDVVAGIERTVKQRNASIVIMGISGKSELSQVIFGSNTLKMAATKACPVLIVPEVADFSPLKNAMLSSDFKNTSKSTPAGPIKAFLSLFKPNLHIVNVDKDHFISLNDHYETEKQNLAEIFSEYKPEFYFMRLYDVDEALSLFAETKDIDLIITIQKNHSFTERLLHGSHTRKLSFHSKIPILVMHE